MQSDTTYASNVWYPIANQNHFALFISRLIAPIAAKQGAHKRLNTRNEYAATAVMLPASCPQISVPFSATSANPKRIPNVPTTFSFAMSPVTAATAIFQSPHPRGANNGAITFPIEARILSLSCSASSIPNEPSTQPKLIKNQSRIVDNVMIVPAFLINDHPLSHMLRSTFPTVGIWYAGSSITNGAGSPANIFVFFKIIPEQMIAAIPTKYALGATHEAPSNNAPAMSAMIGSFAPHGINVVVIIVILRSRSFSIVRDAITPGTPQPVPINIGINDFPERPNLRKILSMINATRAMYPHDSKNARKMKSTSICGTKPRTAPTPATIPSRINPCSHAAQLTDTRSFSIAGGIISPKSTSFVQSVTKAPTVVTET